MSDSYYHILPAWFRKIIAPVLEMQLKFLYRLYRIVNDLFPRTLKVLLSATTDDHKQYLLPANSGEATEYLISWFPVEKPLTAIPRRIPLRTLGPRFKTGVHMMLVEGDRIYTDWMEK